MSNRLFVFPIQITSQQVCTIERNSMLLNDPLLLQTRHGIPTINCWSKHLGPCIIQQIYWRVVGKSFSHDSFSISDLKCDPKPIRIQPISQKYHRPILVSANPIFFFCGHCQARLLHHIEKQPSTNIKINLFQKDPEVIVLPTTNYQNINIF